MFATNDAEAILGVLSDTTAPLGDNLCFWRELELAIFRKPKPVFKRSDLNFYEEYMNIVAV
jgi:hypothetical protein